MREPVRQASRALAVLGLIVFIAATDDMDFTTRDPELEGRGNKKFGDRCERTEECGFLGSICDHMNKCACIPDLPITNHLDKCGKKAAVNESCFFNEQCEEQNIQTECKDGRCMCRFELTPIFHNDGKIECIALQPPKETIHIDPAMIGVLVGMALMFVIICVVLRLFSNARWRENRTIFNTPNPRLMNVSLLRESKLLHQDRRNSRGSVRGPSRQPSMASLRPHSPNSQGNSRRGSKASSNASAASIKSNKSPTGAAAPTVTASQATTPMLESVTVEVQS